MSSEISAELIEDIFGKHSDSVCFANFCNSVVIAQSSAPAPTMPILSEKPGADGSMDGEWTIPAEVSLEFKSPFGVPGWNIFQYKARGIVGGGRQKAFSQLCSDIKGVLPKLFGRLTQPKECSQYSLFTNLQLGLETPAKTADDKLLQKHREQLANAIAEGGDGKASVKIFDAAQLAAIVNAHPALRLTYFSGPIACSWEEAWVAERRIKDYKPSVQFIGRTQELTGISELLKDTSTKVIVIPGPSGMGKTRLALEATRPFALSTTSVELVDELLGMDFRAFGTSKTTRLIIVEDPTREQAETLARRAIASEGIKLILTVPTDTKAPALKLTEHEAIKILLPLQPLSTSDAETLLKTAGASFDRQALSWILLQAGGNPEILLSAAELQHDIREKSGDLKKRLYERLRAKIEKELGLDAVRTLKVLSPILYVKFQGENSELKLVCDSLPLGIQPPRIIELLPDLENMGYVRRRGNYVSVVPPLFAARLVEELLATQEASMRNLFITLDKVSRGRFLERLVTTEIQEQSTFWDFIFGESGSAENGSPIPYCCDHADCLARAVPARIARFLEVKLKNETSAFWSAGASISTLRELAYQEESCACGMRCLEVLAVREIEQTQNLKETKLFCECFVDWYHDFPMSFQERTAWIDRLLKSQHEHHRLLGVHVVAFVTSPPQMLSGYTSTARRLGSAPPRRTWGEVYDYVSGLVNVRFDLTQSSDERIAQIARHEFEQALSQLFGHVSPDQLVAIIEQFVEWSFDGRLSSDVRQLRSTINWVEGRFTDSRQSVVQPEIRDKWGALLQRLAILRQRFDNGNFLIRLKIATGHGSDYEWEAGEEGRVYRYQKRLRLLAVELISNPDLRTQETWNVLKDQDAQHVGEFIRFLGECDIDKQFVSLFEAQTGDRHGHWRFGHYCCGVYCSDSAYVEAYLDRLANTPSFCRAALLWAIRFIGSTLPNRRRLIQFIRDKAVAPGEVADMFTSGRWLENVPVAEVVIIMEYIMQGAKGAKWAAHVLSLYLHLNKPLPKELFPIGERILEASEVTLDESHECNNIARGIAITDLEKGFALFYKHLAALNESDWHELRGGWSPLQRYGTHEFWDYLRTQDTERAYRCLCVVQNSNVRIQLLKLDHGGQPLLDLASHHCVLLRIANESEENAERIGSLISMKQPGYFAFAYELLSGRPLDGRVASAMSSMVVDSFGFSSSMDGLQHALNAVELELKKPGTPNHGREWLENLIRRIREALKAVPWNIGNREYLGWN